MRQLSFVQIFQSEAQLHKPVHYLSLVELPVFLRSLAWHAGGREGGSMYAEDCAGTSVHFTVNRKW